MPGWLKMRGIAVSIVMAIGFARGSEKWHRPPAHHEKQRKAKLQFLKHVVCDCQF